MASPAVSSSDGPWLTDTTASNLRRFTNNNNNDFQNNAQNAQDNFDRRATAITTGWIVGIVIMCVSAIVAVALLLWMYRRNTKRRQARMAQFSSEPKSNWPPNGNQNPGAGLQSPSQPPAVWSPSGYGQHNELDGHAIPPRYEAPNTPVPPQEMPNSEVKPQHQPPREADSNPRSELPV
ncbi:hypothetical protein F5Y04DRAFT_186270 [Hypomontagnella monticulosa]|nr:hypothetical protein F5Y04DRAFT_186270 [Hypomontagnella monticulosa]